MPYGKRPFRHIDRAQGGTEIVNGVADRVCVEFLRQIDLAGLLSPASSLDSR
jgi:hypothetical protein